MPASINEMNTLIARQVVYLGAGMKVQEIGAFTESTH